MGKAPNGKTSNIPTRKQWLQVRTVAFKNFFGDWENVALYNMAKRAFSGEEYVGTYRFSPSERLKLKLESVVGTPIKYVMIENSSIVHIKKRHGENEESRGQIDMTPEDIALLPYYMNNYDTIIPNPKYDTKEGPAYTIYKRINGVVVVGTIKKGKDGVAVVTNFQKKVADAQMLREAPELNALDASAVAKIHDEIELQKEKLLNCSKVVDENGEPLIVFHGTRNGGFNVFDTSKAEEPRLVKTKNAFWFTDSKQMAESFSGENETNFRGKNPMTYKCFLDMRNPLVVDFEGKSWGESIYGSTDEIVRKAQDEGYDGVILKNVRDGGMYSQFLTNGNEYIVFEPNQIKSATDNIGTFDKANPDIRYSRRENTREGSGEVATPAFKNNRGTKIARGGKVGGVAYEVGKVMAGTIYFHKDYADQVLPEGLLEQAEQYLPEGFEYNTLAWDPKQPNVLRFDECKGFDTDPNPVVGRQFKVNVDTGQPLYKTPDGTRFESQIFHDKWQWVGNDYEGFDVQESYNWSKLYNSRIDSTPSGRVEKWQEQLRKAGLSEQGEKAKMQLYRDTAENVAKSVGEEVTVVEDIEDITDDNPTLQLKKRGAKGWYDPERGMEARSRGCTTSGNQKLLESGNQVGLFIEIGN